MVCPAVVPGKPDARQINHLVGILAVRYHSALVFVVESKRIDIQEIYLFPVCDLVMAFPDDPEFPAKKAGSITLIHLVEGLDCLDRDVAGVLMVINVCPDMRLLLHLRGPFQITEIDCLLESLNNLFLVQVIEVYLARRGGECLVCWRHQIRCMVLSGIAKSLRQCICRTLACHGLCVLVRILVHQDIERFCSWRKINDFKKR